MYKQPVLEGLEGLLAGSTSATTKDELGAEVPVLRHIPLGAHLVVDDGVVVLKVGAEALGLERCPGGELMHSAGVFRPRREVVGVRRKGPL